MSRDISVGIATGYRFNVRGSISGGNTIFLYSTATRLALVPGVLSRKVKRPCCEPDDSPPPNSEDENGEAIPPLPHTSSWRDA
jgi:hypothetical protein